MIEEKQKLLEVLTDYCDFKCFQNPSYTKQVKFEWSADLETIKRCNRVFIGQSHQEIIQYIPQISLGFSMVYNQRAYTTPIPEDREIERAFNILRQTRLWRDQCNLERIIGSLDPSKMNEMVQTALRCHSKSSNKIYLALLPENVPSDLNYDSKLNDIGITCEEDITGKGIGDTALFDLYFYGGRLHREAEKIKLYTAYVSQFGEQFIEQNLDWHAITFFHISQNIFIPLLKKSLANPNMIP